MKKTKCGRRPSGCLLIFMICILMAGCTGRLSSQRGDISAGEGAPTGGKSSQGKDISRGEDVFPGSQLWEERLEIEGLTGEYELLFLTDTHVLFEEGELSEQEKEYIASRKGMFESLEGISPAEQLSLWLSYAEEEQLDGVLLGGDIIDCPSEENLEYLAEELSGLEIPYVYTPGNHDWTYPWEYMTEKGRQEYLQPLSVYMDGNASFHFVDFGEFIVAAVDNSSGQVAEEALAEYEKVLEQGKPVLVLAHVPFLTQSVLAEAREVWEKPAVIGGGNFGGIYPNETSEKFVEMTVAADSPVEAVLTGHVHFYDKDVIEGEKDVVQLVGDAGFHGSALRLSIGGTDAGE